MESTPHPLRAHLITGLVLGVVFGGALIAVWQDGQSNLADYASDTREKTQAFERRLTALEARLGTLESAPKDNTALDGLRADITALQTSNSQMQEALDVLQKQPVRTVEIQKAETTSSAAPLAAAVNSGEPYASELKTWVKTHPDASVSALRTHAASGLPTEMALREQFKTLITRLTADSTASDGTPPILARINTHLAGLVSIRKTSDHRTEYTALRDAADAPLDQLAAKVDALPDEAQAPFTAWRSAVKTRSEALAELTTLPQDTTP